MEKEIDTNLGYLVFYIHTIKERIILEKIFVYHIRSLGEDDELEDYIYFSSPNRCNMYGNTFSMVMEENIHNQSKYISFRSYDYDDLFFISRIDYMRLCGIMDYLLYHRFKTEYVRYSVSLLDKENFNSAIEEVKEIVDKIKVDLLLMYYGEHLKINYQDIIYNLHIEFEKLDKDKNLANYTSRDKE